MRPIGRRTGVPPQFARARAPPRNDQPLEPLRSKVVGAGAPNKDATWLPAPSQAADLLSTKNFYFADRSTPLDLEAIRDIDLERIEKDVNIEALQRHLEPLVFGRLPEVLLTPARATRRFGSCSACLS